MKKKAKLTGLRKTRGYKRQSATRLTNKYSDITNVDPSDFSPDGIRLKKLAGELDQLDTQIIECSTLVQETIDETAEFNENEEYQDKIQKTIAKINNNTMGATANSNSNAAIANNPQVVNTTKLLGHKVELPIFSSTPGEDFTRFLTLFEAGCDQFKYNEQDKFKLLKDHVKGRAQSLINSLEVTNQSYQQAVALLTKALASKEAQISNTIKTLTSLKLKYSDEPFEFYSKFKNIMENIATLQIGASDFARFFIWDALNDSFQNQLRAVTNKNFPTLTEIDDSFFSACERYDNAREKFNSKKAKANEYHSNKNVSTSLAADVNYNKGEKKKIYCILCIKDGHKNVSHSLKECNTYADATSKIKKLNSLKGCISCGRLNHMAPQCPVVQFNCRCGEKHFTMFCTKSSNREEKVTKPPVKKPNSNNGNSKPSDSHNNQSSSSSDGNVVQSSMQIGVITRGFQSQIGGNSILPTFTCEINNGFKVRTLRDTGCQDNFILQKIANQLNLPVDDNHVELTIKGINAAKSFITKAVIVNMKVDNEIHCIRALCVPTLDIFLKLQKLGLVVQGFKNKGYKLADEYLDENSKAIDNIQLLLGSKSAHCLRTSDIGYGSNNSSAYSNSKLGVLLTGDVDQVLKDLHSLPFLTNSSTNFASAAIESQNNYVTSGLYNCCSRTDVNSDIEFGENGSCVKFNIMEDDGKINRNVLQKATSNILEESCRDILNIEKLQVDDLSTEQNNDLVKFCLDNVEINDENRIQMPLMWNSKSQHMLGKNKNLALAILKSNLKKLQKNPDHLRLMDDVFREQQKSGIIKKIPNIEKFMAENPNYSFLAHMGVFRLKRDTTKCRVVYLSNLCEKDNEKLNTVSHNQAMYSGPSLNQKLSASLLHLRFDDYLFVYDLEKAFNQIALNENDAARLLCFWFKDPMNGDFTVEAFQNVKLSFGLRCSPTLLCLALYYLLVLDTENDSNDMKKLKQDLYSLFYVDNGAYTSNDRDKLQWAFNQLSSIFGNYKFNIQQVVSNDCKLQASFDGKNENETPVEAKLLGCIWNRVDDTIYAKKFELDCKAKTKRTILSSIASQYDLFNIQAPLLNRARLFMHELQCQKNLGWDEDISAEKQKEWHNIVSQINSVEPLALPRKIGSREDEYDIVVATDSSKSIYGIVVYLKNRKDNSMHFIMSKNRLVNTNTCTKSIHNLELLAILLGTQTAIDVLNDLSGKSCLNPIKIVDIQIYSDSLVSLSWIRSHSITLDKMNKYSVFTQNKLNDIQRLCTQHPIKFSFLSGTENPADMVTRCFSSKTLKKTSYLFGPKLEAITLSSIDRLNFNVPTNGDEINDIADIVEDSLLEDKNLKNSSSLSNAFYCTGIFDDEDRPLESRINVKRGVLRAVWNFKRLLFKANPNKYSKWEHEIKKPPNFYWLVMGEIIAKEQKKEFPEIFEYFEKQNPNIKDIPNIVTQLNVLKDKSGLLRVCSKFSRWSDKSNFQMFPILLPRKNKVTNEIILNMHYDNEHIGCYTLLSELRKHYYVSRFFSVVKKVLKDCVICKRHNGNPVKLNQNAYRSWRVTPPRIPFAYLFMDHMGPYYVKVNNETHKRWILVLTCMYTRAVNLIVCDSLSVDEFLYAFQTHCFQYGTSQYVLSDLGSQFTAASKTIQCFLQDSESQKYFEENGVECLKFDQYFKGCSSLGSMVETVVKMSKKLVNTSVGKLVLKEKDFNLLMAQTIHLINRRPIAFKETLRANDPNEILPEVVTPEMLVHGYNLPSINVIPNLQADIYDIDWTDDINNNIQKDCFNLIKARTQLYDNYHGEFLQTLISRAIDKKGRYQPKKHKKLEIGDIVLIHFFEM